MAKNTQPTREGLIFLHIWKAGGSTLNDIIERQYAGESIFTTNGARYEESMAEFQNLPSTERAAFRVLKGHMYFGMHEYFFRPCRYITMLRDPVSRVISDYYYIWETPHHNFYDFVVNQEKMSLQSFVSREDSPLYDNVQTRLLSGIAWQVKFGEAKPDMLALAKENIDKHFAVVGLTERFDETLILCQLAFNWKMPFYTKRNVTQKKADSSNMDAETLEVIRQYNALDIELYEYAQKRFEQQIQSYGDRFWQQLKSFQFYNQFYKPYYLSRRAVKKLQSLVGR